MALTLTAIRRTGGPGCQHVELTLDVDGQTRTLTVERDEIVELLKHLPHPPDVILTLLWVARKLRSGATPASLSGQVIA